MKTPRGLTAEEQAACERLAQTVMPLDPPQNGEGDHAKNGGGADRVFQKPSARAPSMPLANPAAKPPTSGRVRVPLHRSPAGPSPRLGEDKQAGLDSHWNRQLKAGQVAPDFTLDLHGLTLDNAYDELLGRLRQANAMGARLVLVVTGKPRPVDAADRGTSRGAIRAKILDWLAASSLADDIAAIRKAHRRPGGEGALYLVLRRRR